MRVFIILVSLLIIAMPAMHAEKYDSDIILQVDINGLKNIEKANVFLAIKIKPGERVSQEVIQQNMNNIYSLGYFSDVGVEVTEFNGGKKLTFNVVENAIIKEIDITGNTLLTKEQILEVMKVKKNDVYNIPLLNEDIKRIASLYSERGYVFCTVTDVKAENNGEKINLTVTEGVLEAIKLEGNNFTKEWVILREFLIKEGEIYNENKVKTSLKRVFNLGFFESIKRTYEQGTKPQNVILIVEIKEQKTGSASLGGAYGSVNGFVGFVEVAKNNFRGRGQSLKLKLEFGNQTTYELGFVEPWFRHKPISLGVNVYKTEITEKLYDSAGNNIGDYDKKTTGGDITVGKRLATYTNGSVRFKDATVRLSPETDYLRGGRYQSITTNVIKDTRNNNLNPSEGLLDGISIETTGGILAGNNQYTKYITTLRRYYGLKPRLNLALRLMHGIINVGGGIVPLYEKYGVGGSKSLRGYESREFVGKHMLVGNMELRYTFTNKVIGSVFYDMGDAKDGRSLNFSMKKGFGFGVNIGTPLGMIRLDYGKAPDRGGRTYFSMGNMF